MTSWKNEESVHMTDEGDKDKAPALSLGGENMYDEFSIDAALSFTPTPLQARILDVAQTLMEDHYTLDTERLHKTCVRVIKDYDRVAIDMALSDLYYNRVLVEGKAVTKISIMENINRQDIYKIIKQKPGISAARLKQELALSFGTISWHLKMLTKFKLVRIEMMNDAITCFDTSVDKAQDAAHVAVHKKQVPEILAAFLSRGKMRPGELGQLLAIPKTTLLRKLRELEAAGILIRERGNDDEGSLDVAQMYLPVVQRVVK